MAEIKLTNQNFETEALNSDIPVLIDFWAEWCGPCRMLAPVIEEITAERAGKIKVGKVNVDEEPALAMQYGVVSIPMVVILKGGKIAGSTIGYRNKAQMDAFIDGIL